MPYSSRPKYFNKWDNIWIRWESLLKENNISPLDACINDVQHEKYIDKYIVGVESLEQLKQIFRSSKKKEFDLDLNEFNNNDTDLINPSSWANTN